MTPGAVRCSAWLGVIGDWKKRAAKMLADARGEENEMGKRLIEHGAMCYINAAREAEEALRRIENEAPRS